MQDGGYNTSKVSGLDPIKMVNRPSITRFKTTRDIKLDNFQRKFMRLFQCIGSCSSVLFSMDCITVLQLISILKKGEVPELLKNIGLPFSIDNAIRSEKIITESDRDLQNALNILQTDGKRSESYDPSKQD